MPSPQPQTIKRLPKNPIGVYANRHKDNLFRLLCSCNYDLSVPADPFLQERINKRLLSTAHALRISITRFDCGAPLSTSAVAIKATAQILAIVYTSQLDLFIMRLQISIISWCRQENLLHTAKLRHAFSTGRAKRLLPLLF